MFGGDDRLLKKQLYTAFHFVLLFEVECGSDFTFIMAKRVRLNCACLLHCAFVFITRSGHASV